MSSIKYNLAKHRTWKHDVVRQFILYHSDNLIKSSEFSGKCTPGKMEYDVVTLYLWFPNQLHWNKTAKCIPASI